MFGFIFFYSIQCAPLLSLFLFPAFVCSVRRLTGSKIKINKKKLTKADVKQNNPLNAEPTNGYNSPENFEFVSISLILFK